MMVATVAFGIQTPEKVNFAREQISKTSCLRLANRGRGSVACARRHHCREWAVDRAMEAVAVSL